MPWFKSRVIDIEAVQWTGKNLEEVEDFVGKTPQGYKGFFIEGEDDREGGVLWIQANTNWSGIEIGEWILHDSRGFYPCKDDIFKKKYEEV